MASTTAGQTHEGGGLSMAIDPQGLLLVHSRLLMYLIDMTIWLFWRINRTVVVHAHALLMVATAVVLG